MSLRDRIASWIASKPETAPAPQASTPLPQITRGTEAFGWFGDNLGKLPAPSESTALTVSAIYACVNLIAGAISALPVNIYRRNIEDGERDRIFNDDLHWVLNEEMAPRWTSASGWEFLTQSLLIHGDGFAPIIRRGPTPVGLVPTHPKRVTVMVNTANGRLVYAVEPEFAGQQVQVYDQDDMLHIPGFGFDGFRGASPLRYALRMTAPAAIAMQEFAANFFANSARPDYALQTDQSLGEDAVKNLRAQIDERHAGPENAHRPMLLHSGLDIKNITMPMEDLQLVTQRQFQIEEIARIYGVPPFMIGHNEKTTSWGSGVDAMGIGFVRYTLRQHLNKIENEINRKLFRTASRVAEFDTTELERADTKSLFESLRIAVGRAGEPKIMSVDEARAVLRMKKGGTDETKSLAPNAAASAPAPEPASATQ